MPLPPPLVFLMTGGRDLVEGEGERETEREELGVAARAGGPNSPVMAGIVCSADAGDDDDDDEDEEERDVLAILEALSELSGLAHADFNGDVGALAERPPIAGRLGSGMCLSSGETMGEGPGSGEGKGSNPKKPKVSSHKVCLILRSMSVSVSMEGFAFSYI